MNYVKKQFKKMIDNGYIYEKEEQQDFYSAVDLVVNKLERQIRKNKTRMNKNNTINLTKFSLFETTNKYKIESNNNIEKLVIFSSL